MSDSEEEAAFASADEGESPKGDQGSKKTQQAAKKGSAPKNSSANAATASKSKTDTPSTEASGKQKGKQQQQQKQPQANTKKKGKGRGNSQPAASSKPKESSPDVPPVTDTETPSPAKPDSEDGKTVSEPESQSQTTVSSQSPKESKPSISISSDQQPAKDTATAATSSDVAEKEEEMTTKQAGDIRRGIDVSPEKEKTPVTADKGDDDSDNVKATQPTPAPEKSTGGGGGWGWGSWGSSILSAATNSVQTFTDQVGGGLVTIIDTVESSLGVPDAEELAKANASSEGDSSKKDSSDSVETTQPTSSKDDDAAATATEKPQADESSKQDDKNETETNESKGGGGGGGGGWFASWGVADIAKKVTDTGKSIATKGQTLVTEGFDAVENLASGGIDVLESIGKKTYSTISEHDPSFKKTREYLRSKNEKTNLSGLLKEAKERAEEEATQKAENEEARKAHFGTLFDEYQGIAHLEALEILSNQSEKKVHSLLNTLSSGDIKAIKPVLISIKEVFEVEDQEDRAEEGQDQDFSSLVSQYLSELELGTAPDKLNKVHGMVKQWMVDFDAQEAKGKETPKTIHQQAIQSLAELTSKGVEQFHKAGELVLMQRESDKDCKERAHSFARLTGVLCHEVGNLATKFSDCLNKAAADDEDKTDITSLVTNVYLEASNSSTYMQDAFQLLLPVLQQAAIEHSVLARQS